MGNIPPAKCVQEQLAFAGKEVPALLLSIDLPVEVIIFFLSKTRASQGKNTFILSEI